MRPFAAALAVVIACTACESRAARLDRPRQDEAVARLRILMYEQRADSLMRSLGYADWELEFGILGQDTVPGTEDTFDDACSLDGPTEPGGPPACAVFRGYRDARQARRDAVSELDLVLSDIRRLLR